MSYYYVACDLGAQRGRIMLGTLHKDVLHLSEIRRFDNVPVQEEDALQWNIPQLYQEVLDGLRSVGGYEEPLNGISCSSWGGDYMLFDSDGSLITPTYHHSDPRGDAGMKRVLSNMAPDEIYRETGFMHTPRTTLSQLGAESSRRLKRASQLFPVADGFNYLLTGTPRVEVSQASATQLFNPVSGAWSESVLSSLRLPPTLLPPLAPAGTQLGGLKKELIEYTGLDEAQVVSGCSHELSATLTGLPVAPGENWAFLRAGTTSLIGTQVPEPIINDLSRDMQFINQPGLKGSVAFYKHIIGLWILEECQRHWRQSDRGLDFELLTHLAGSATAFESLINPADPRFLTPDDMPLKIQAFCKETNQPVPRKPGPIFRCILESLALSYRKSLQELEFLTGSSFTKLYLLGNPAHSLFNYFIANALQIPVVIVPPETSAIGSILVQAVGLGHLRTLEYGQAIVRSSFKTPVILPHANAWNDAYDRMMNLLK